MEARLALGGRPGQAVVQVRWGVSSGKRGPRHEICPADRGNSTLERRMHRPEREMKDGAKWWVLVTVGIGTFMSALNGSVVNTVLPVMRRELHADFATIEWVVTIYLLVVSGLRSQEHTSELQSRSDLVCRLLLEKKRDRGA